MPELENAETVQSIDILENDIVKIAPQILEILLQDKTTKAILCGALRIMKVMAPRMRNIVR